MPTASITRTTALASSLLPPGSLPSSVLTAARGSCYTQVSPKPSSAQTSVVAPALCDKAKVLPWPVRVHRPRPSSPLQPHLLLLVLLLSFLLPNWSPQTHQACSCLRTFALAVPSICYIPPPHFTMLALSPDADLGSNATSSVGLSLLIYLKL